MDKTKEVLTQAQVALSNQAMYEKVQKDAIDKEFSRYKQDCRKKSLEWAEQEKCHWIAKDDGKHQHFTFDVIGLADKYYNWLISIPQ